MHRTGFICKTQDLLLGSPVYISGTYRERSVLIYHYGFMPATHIEINIKNPANASLRLRGPVEIPPRLKQDEVLEDMFSASKLRLIGQNPRFLLGGDPLHISTNVISTASLKERILQLTEFIDIEIEGKKLRFRQAGLVYDENYLCFILELLSDLVDVVEQGSNARKIMLSARGASNLSSMNTRSS